MLDRERSCSARSPMCRSRAPPPPCPEQRWELSDDTESGRRREARPWCCASLDTRSFGWPRRYARLLGAGRHLGLHGSAGGGSAEGSTSTGIRVVAALVVM